MSKYDRVELSREEPEAVNGGGFRDDAWEFSKCFMEENRKRRHQAEGLGLIRPFRMNEARRPVIHPCECASPGRSSSR